MSNLNVLDYEKAYEQLYLYEQSEEEKIREEIKLLKESMHRVRKGQYARIGDLMKKYTNLEHEFECLKASICRK